MSQWWFCFLQTCSFQFTRHLQIDWSHGDYLRIIVKFLAAVWILILTAPIHCRGSTGEQVIECNISPSLFQWRNKLIYILGRGLIYFLFILAAFSLQAPLHFCLLLVRLLISSVVESSHLHADFHIWEVSEGHLSGDKLPEQHCKAPHVRRAPVNLFWLLLQRWEEKRYQWIKISYLRCGHCSANFCR